MRAFYSALKSIARNIIKTVLEKFPHALGKMANKFSKKREIKKLKQTAGRERERERN
jgi:predicted hydrocarbon binding protein